MNIPGTLFRHIAIKGRLIEIMHRSVNRQSVSVCVNVTVELRGSHSVNDVHTGYEYMFAHCGIALLLYAIIRRVTFTVGIQLLIFVASIASTA